MYFLRYNAIIIGMEVLLLLFTLNTDTLNLPKGLINSICFIESSYNVAAIHHDDGGSDSLGICQIKLSTAKWMGYKGTATDLMNPVLNIHYAAKYLKYLSTRYNNDYTKVIIAYNRGNAKSLTRTKYSDKVKKYWSKNFREETNKLFPAGSRNSTLSLNF